MKRKNKMDRQDTKRLRGSKKRIYRIMAGIMVLICILPLCHANVFASAETGICPHHPAHTDACGYRASADGKSCAHEHNDICGYTEAGGEDTCGHVHDDVCGYAEAAGEIPCGFICEICSKEDGSADAGMENGQEPDPGMNDGTGTKPGDGQSPVTGSGDETDVNENGSEEPGDMPEDGSGAPEDESGAPEDESGVPGDEGDTEDRGETGTDPSCAVVSWGWESEYLTLDETTGRWYLGLPGAGEENPVTPDVLSEMLPKEITAVLADGTEAVLPLAWDYSALEAPAAVEAGGVYEGSYVLTAALPDPYALAEDAAQISVLVEIGGGEGYADPIDKYVSNWKYVSRGGSEIREITTTQNPTDTYTYTMDYYLSLTSDREEIIGKIKSVLPRQIECDGYYDQNLADAGFDPKEENLSVDGKIHRGYVVIDWTNIEEVFRLAGTLGEGTKLTFYAMPVSNHGYRLRVNSNSPVLNEKQYENYNDTAERDDILNLTVTIHEIHLTDHIVAGINPPNTTVNLFDYWVDRDGGNPLIKDNTDQERNDLLATTDMHKNTANEPVDRNGVEDWNRGINQGRLLLFGDGNIHAGFWNKGAGAGSGYGAAKAGMPGIIKPVLGTDGYPVMNTPDMKNMLDGYQGILDYQLCGDHIAGSDTLISDSPQNISKTVIANWNNGSASLDYLFDPQTPNQYKRSYENATGLFQLDNNGYYYYDMRQNFAEYNSDSGEFVLYDAPAVDRTDLNPLTGLRSVGNFFPFNTGAQVFDQVDQATGKLSSNASIGSSNLTTTAGYMNHHLGMTVNIDFRQPLEGKINTGSSSNIPMTFQFSGDDDVWIFIDDVLVLDLGGIHSEIYGTIDFSDGTIRVGQSWKTNGFPYNADGTVNLEKLYQDADPVLTTTLRQQFDNAGRLDSVLWNNNTFASNTSHTLKMFYLERGNYDSSLALRFNLQPMLYQQIAKVDQNGKLVGGVEFDLVPAELTTADAAGAIECLYTDNNAHSSGEFFVRQSENRALVHIVTNADGTTRFLDDEGNYFNFADRGRQYYILKETRTPDGYRSLPIDVVLFYDPSTSMLSVANRWTTGAYACSVANIVGTGGVDYGSFNSGTGEIESDRDPGSGEILQVDGQARKDGLVVAVPMLLRESDQSWEAMYGGNLVGFDVSTVVDASEAGWRNAALYAVLEQAANQESPEWALSWDATNLRLAGTLNDLPGLANRYRFDDPDSDMRLIFAIIEPEALQQLGITGNDTQERYAALGSYVREHGVDETLTIIESTQKTTGAKTRTGFSLLNTNQFIRDFRSLIYIPNDQRELWVMKVDQDGRPRNGTTFAMYDNEACAGDPVAQGVTATVYGQEGTLIFSPADDAGPGYAKMMWASYTRTRYYLKEIAAPDGCRLNQTVVPVVVGSRSIYADAGTREDGVSVMAGVGRLTQTMRQYAMDSEVDITLRDITAFGQYQPSANTQVLSQDWRDMELEGSAGVKRALNLHFGKNAVVDYGLHNEDGGQLYKPVFIADTGFARARVEQNYTALSQPVYEGSQIDANKDNLGDTDITNLFSLLNIVVVTDQMTSDTGTGKLMVGKTLSGAALTERDYTRNFWFTIRLTDANGRELTGDYHFYGTDKSGSLASGRSFPLHHDERITILGLPEGASYTVTEILPQDPNDPDDWYPLPGNGTAEGEIIKDATSFAPFFNSRTPWPDIGFLIIHKTVTRGGDRTKNFTFTVSLTDAAGNPLAGSFPYAGDKRGSISDGESVSLRHDEYIIIFDLPAGTQYSVTEQEAGMDGYTTSFYGNTGTVETGGLYTASFLNDMEWPKEEDGSQNPPAGSGVIPVVYGEITGAVRAGRADTADDIARRLTLPVSLMILSALGMAVLMRKRR